MMVLCSFERERTKTFCIDIMCWRQLLCFSHFRQTQIKKLKVKVGKKNNMQKKIAKNPPKQKEQNLGILIV